MNNKTKAIVYIAAFVLLFVVAATAYSTLSKKEKPQMDGGANASNGESPESEKQEAPDFTVYDFDGNAVKLSDLKGKPIVLNFWASWCSSCKTAMPNFNTVYEELGEDVTFAIVDMVDGKRETEEIGKKHIEDNGYTFPVYYDIDQDAAYAYGVTALPTTYFIDKDGYIITGARGALDEETLRLGISMIE